MPDTTTFLEAISWQWEDSCGGIHENKLVAELGPGEKTWLSSCRYKGGLLISNQLTEVNYVQQQCMAHNEKKIEARLNKAGKAFVSVKNEKKKNTNFFSINTKKTTKKNVCLCTYVCI